ncbi:MAG: DUF4149 domain-containing protein [Candidatus Binataceae bacterium]|jgi:uncharacterized membrane protein
MLSLRLFVLFIHVTAVIVALGGSLFSTFALAPVLAEELDVAPRVRVARRVVQRLGVIVLSALAILIVTGIFNVMFLGAIGPLLSLKLVLVAVVMILAIYQYGMLGMRIWRVSANGPDPALAPLQARFRSVGLKVGMLVLVIVYLSLGLSRAASVPTTLAMQ